jgi:hypothetical protein
VAERLRLFVLRLLRKRVVDECIALSAPIELAAPFFSIDKAAD